MNTTDPWMERLSEYLDGELRPEERDALETHLDTCTACTATLAELRRVVEGARALPEPTLRDHLQADLWSAIAPQLAPRHRSLGERMAALLRPAGGRFSLTVPQLAAAALALVVVSAGITYFGPRLAGRRATEPTELARRTDTTRVSEPSQASRSLGTVDALPASFDEARYAAAVGELEQTLRTHRSELDPATVRALEENLALIDEAVFEAKRALVADPSNPYLSGHLANQMHRKVRVLQRAAMIVAATR